LQSRLLYIHEGMKIYCNRREIYQSKGIAKTKKIAYQHLKITIGVGERAVKCKS